MRIVVLCSIFMFCFCAAGADWEVWDDFSGQTWVAQDWPLTQNSKTTLDATHAKSGTKALHTTISCGGWGGGYKLDNPPLMRAPRQGMEVFMYCEPAAGASGAPKGKLEVYSAADGETFGGPDVTLAPGQWTRVRAPRSAIRKPFAGCGIIFFSGEAKGDFRVWVDALSIDGRIWEDFESAAAARVWEPVNITGAFRCSRVGPRHPRMPELETGLAMRLAWDDDADGVELKTFPSPPLDASEWKRVRVRIAVPEDAPPPHVNLWFHDGEKGSFSTGPRVTTKGRWVEVTHDMAPHRDLVNLRRLTEVAVVLKDYGGRSGEVFVDRIEYEK